MATPVPEWQQKPDIAPSEPYTRPPYTPDTPAVISAPSTLSPPMWTAGIPATSPNWYPDPINPGLLRYWDGFQWTEYRQAAAPQATAMVINQVSVSGGGGSDVALHLILTILTCGLWLPIWLLIEVIKAICR